MKRNASNSTISGLMWSFAERFGAQLISFIISIVLARILLPSDYGVVALVSIFINIANSFVTGGFGNSLIQKRNADNLDFSTVFWFNIAFSFFVYLIVFLISPFVEIFYNQSGLALVMQILGVRLILTGINSVQRAYVARHMQFKKFFFATLGGTIISAFVGIWMAMEGFGVWALVFQYLTNATIDTIILFVAIRWRPQFCFSSNRLKGLFSFGWKLLASSVISSVWVELNEMVIGKAYTSDDLAYYNQGKKIPSLLVNNIISAIETVLFPSMSKIQDKKKALKEKTRKSIQFSTFLIFPMMFGLAACSNTIILTLLTEKWAESIPYLALACISYALNPIGMANLQAYKAMGKSGLYLKIDICKKIIGISVLLICLRFGVLAIATGVVFTNILGFFLNVVPNKKYLNYGVADQMKDIFPTLLITIFMFVAVYFENFLLIDLPVLLIIQVLTGVIIYFGSAFLTKNKVFMEILYTIKNRNKLNEKS